MKIMCIKPQIKMMTLRPVPGFGFIIFTMMCILEFSDCRSQNRFLLPGFSYNPDLRTEIDSSKNIKNLSGKAYVDLIEEMFVVDQKYRDSLMKYKSVWANKNVSEIPINIRNYMKLEMLNDKANQKLLFRLLNYYGWPRSAKQKDISEKIWVIVWHATNEEEVKFYKYIKKAEEDHFYQKVLIIT